MAKNLFAVAACTLAILCTYLVQPASAWISCRVDDCTKCLADPGSCGCWNIADVYDVCGYPPPSEPPTEAPSETQHQEWPSCKVDDCAKCLADPGSCGCWNIADVHRACPQRQDATVPGANGDPHFKTWSGEKYDFHGVCDLVLLTSQEVNIHIRTKKTRRWSYIHSTSIQIHDDILEVMGGSDKNNFWINKVPGGSMSDIQVSNYPVEFTQVSEKSRQFVIDMGDGKGKITVKTWNGMVSVSLTHGSLFEESRGLMGTYPDGLKVSRSSDTVMHNNDAFGMEWQVQKSEPQLFHTPSNVLGACKIPSKSQLRRQLGDSTISTEDAELACARVSKEDFDLCVFDVMATNDKESAGAY